MANTYLSLRADSHGNTRAHENSVFTATFPSTRAVPLKMKTEDMVSVNLTLIRTVSPGKTCLLNLAPIIFVRTGIF